MPLNMSSKICIIIQHLIMWNIPRSCSIRENYWCPTKQIPWRIIQECSLLHCMNTSWYIRDIHPKRKHLQFICILSCPKHFIYADVCLNHLCQICIKSLNSLQRKWFWGHNLGLNCFDNKLLSQRTIKIWCMSSSMSRSCILQCNCSTHMLPSCLYMQWIISSQIIIWILIIMQRWRNININSSHSINHLLKSSKINRRIVWNL